MAAEWAIRKLSEIAFWAEAALEYEWEHNTAYFIDRVACLGLVSCQLRPGVARSPRMSARGEANQRLLSGDLPSNFDSMSTASAPMVDTSGDAELARRLQMEEQGAGNQPVPNVTQQPRARSARNARTNIMQQAVADQAQASVQSNNPKCSAIVLAVLNLPQAVAVAIVLGSLDDPFDCDRPLGVWCIVAAVRQVLSVICMAATARYHGREAAAPMAAKFLSSLYQPLSTFNLVWFIFGNLWYIGSETDSCNDHLRKLSLSLVIIQYIVMFLPCIILMVSLPFACLCFPLFMRVVSVLNPAPPDQSRGITQEEILAATRVAKWTPGMFGESDDDNMCTITMEPYSAGDQVRILPCEHHFSEDAISTWLRQHNTCPLCRQPILNRGANEPAASSAAGNDVATTDGGDGLRNVTTVHVSQAPGATAQQAQPVAASAQYARIPEV